MAEIKTRYEIACEVHNQVIDQLVRTEIDIEHGERVMKTLHGDKQKLLKDIVIEQNKRKESLRKIKEMLETIKLKLEDYKDQKS